MNNPLSNPINSFRPAMQEITIPKVESIKFIAPCTQATLTSESDFIQQCNNFAVSFLAFVETFDISTATILSREINPINSLNKTLGKSSNKLTTLFEILKEKNGISQENFLPWEDRFMGDTQYIDKIKIADMKGKCIVWGIDRFDRLFITIKFIYTRSKPNFIQQGYLIKKIEKQKQKEGCLTLFQRYTDSSLIVIGSTYIPLFYKSICYETFAPHTKDFLKNLKTLLNGKSITVEKGETRPFQTDTITLAE